jgi:hypothetical protein
LLGRGVKRDRSGIYRKFLVKVGGVMIS